MTTIETDQSREIKLTEITRGPFILRYLSYRKNEDAALDLRSEDYIVGELNPEKTVFSLCDGVGSSFYGNIGSQILGEILLNWLGKISLPGNFDLGKSQSVNKWRERLTSELTSELNGRTAFATSVIQKKELSSQNEMVRLAEITQRDDFGTQSNFACGVVWAKSPSLPEGLVLLFWLGNARLRLFNQNKDLTSLLGWGKDSDQLLEVWSSKDGVVGKVYSYITDLSAVTSIIAYSDGLENSEEKIRPKLNGAQLEGLVQQSQSIKDDDATFLELSTDNREAAGKADDLVVPLRKHMQTVSARVEQTADPDIQKLRATLGALQKKYDAQIRKNNLSRGILLVSTVFFMAFCFFLGLAFGPAIKQIFSPPTETSTPTMTATPTRTRTPTPTFTDTVLPSDTPTLTDTATFTMSPTETATPVTPTVTPMVLLPESTTAIPVSASTPTPTTPTTTGP